MKNIFILTEKTFGRVEKRVRFVISSLILVGIMLMSTFPISDNWWIFIPIFIATTFFFTYFSILEGIEKVEWFTLFFMPVLATVSFYLFYFLFPVRWITRIPFIITYGFSIYALLLTSNIFNVGVDKSLQLYRAAFSVNYFYQTVISFLFFSIILSFKQYFVLNGLIIFTLVLFLSIQLLWSIKLKLNIDRTVQTYSFLMALILGEIAMFLSFVPVKSTIVALFLTACYYSVSGLLYHYIDQKLFKQTIREYIFVLGFVFIIFLLSIQW